MGILEKLAFRAWPQPQPLHPVVNIDRRSVAGLALDQRAEDLQQALGAPDSWSDYRRGYWGYAGLGLKFRIANGKIQDISVVCGPGLEFGRLASYNCFEGTLIAGGQTVQLGKAHPITLSQITTLLGSSKVDRDAEEVVLTYAWPDVYMDFEFRPAEQRKLIYLCAPAESAAAP